MIYRDQSRTELIELAIRRGEVQLSADGALVAATGTYTGRAAQDKYLVRDELTASKVDWGKVNKPITPDQFARLRLRVMRVLESGDSFIHRCSVGADPRYALPVQVHTELAWHAVFADTMFRPALENGQAALEPFHVYAAPSAEAIPGEDGTRSSAFIALSFSTREIIIGGTRYGGEIKKSIFTVMNYLLPQLGIMTMHCAANLGEDGSSALFFGLSGTGKTTLSTDSARRLLGDDEHGWSPEGIFNIEGGCYAKMIRLSPVAEPEIYACAHQFGTVLENVVMDEHSRQLDLDSARITENTRGAYQLRSMRNVELSGVAGQPSAVVMLACDAFGVLPPIARLTPDQAMYYFLSGYTAKVAGTEAGLGKDPVTTFSPCFGEPFMALPATEYARLLGERLRTSGAACYLVNTGWWRGGVGQGGERMPILMSRALVRAAVSGELAAARASVDPRFGFAVPSEAPNVNPDHLKMSNTWSDKDAYDRQSRKLAEMFIENFRRYDGKVDARVREAGPRVD